MQVVRKLLSLSDSVTAELDKEENASALVDVLLGEFYGVEVVEAGKGGPARDEVKARLAEIDAGALPTPSLADQAVALTSPAQDVVQPVEAVPADPTPVPLEIPAPLTITVPVEVATPAPSPTEDTVISPVVEPVVAEVAPVVDNSEVPPSNAPEPTPVVDPAPVNEVTVPVEPPVVEPVVVDPPAPEVVPEPVPTEPEVPINVDGQPGGQCPIHGLFIGSVCIDCL